MTKIDLEALPVDLLGIALANGLPIGITAHPAFKSFLREYKRAFAALLLEKVAQNHDEAAETWGRLSNKQSGKIDGFGHKEITAQQLADDVRQMAAGMGE